MSPVLRSKRKEAGPREPCGPTTGCALNARHLQSKLGPELPVACGINQPSDECGTEEAVNKRLTRNNATPVVSSLSGVSCSRRNRQKVIRPPLDTTLIQYEDVLDIACGINCHWPSYNIIHTSA